MRNNINPKPINSSRSADIGDFAWLISLVSIIEGTFFVLFYGVSRDNTGFYYKYDGLYYLSLFI
jgi:hypothetical protein